MIDRYADYRGREDVVVIPRIRVTFALSILIHIAALWFVFQHLPVLTPGQERDQASERLQVVLNTPPVPAPEPTPAPPPQQRETRAILTARPRPRNAPPRETPPEFVVPVPEAPQVPPPPPPVVEPPKPYPPVEGDLASLIEARRRARGESSASSTTESETERRNRIVAANLPSSQSPMAGQERKRGGGIFEITRMAYDDAEFRFYGLHKDAGRKMTQQYEVRLGNNSDMRIAIIRRMIVLIRETERGDISWDSYRLGRVVEISARPEDNAGLEEFMMHEFFDNAPAARR